MKQILAIVAYNRPGVLMKITGLISRRGYNIESLSSGSTQNPGYARVTITIDADKQSIEQICKQVAKISEVEQIKVLPYESSTLRSMLLVKVRVGEKQMEVLQLAAAFRSHAIDVTGNSMTFEKSTIYGCHYLSLLKTCIKLPTGILPGHTGHFFHLVHFRLVDGEHQILICIRAALCQLNALILQSSG